MAEDDYEEEFVDEKDEIFNDEESDDSDEDEDLSPEEEGFLKGYKEAGKQEEDKEEE